MKGLRAHWPSGCQGSECGCQRPPRFKPTSIDECDFLPTDGSNCRLLNGDFGTSPFCWQPSGEIGPACSLVSSWPRHDTLFARIAMGKPHIF
jgi:hypothetical protein